MKIKLRKWQLEDVPLLALYANDPLIACNLTNAFPHPYTLQDADTFIRTALKQEGLLAITADELLVGSLGIFPQFDIHSKNAEIGYFLARKFWGKGFMTEAVKQGVRYGFATFDINRIFARPFSLNRASQRVLEKAGFTLEARFEKTLFKNGKFMDELIYAIRK